MQAAGRSDKYISSNKLDVEEQAEDQQDVRSGAKGTGLNRGVNIALTITRACRVCMVPERAQIAR